jgi:hypothetical protein
MNILFDMSREQLKALAEYKDVLETGRSFSRNFWQKEKNEDGPRLNCQVITRYCLEQLEGMQVKALPSCKLAEIKEILVKNHLHGMVQTVFRNDILKVLTNAYPAEFKKRELAEWMWSSHGIWSNDGFVIEAVQHMILREGIRRVDFIPRYDWKKRLMKYGIYNVLSRFHWSVFHLFNFVYPGRFHPADFKYKVKWKTDSGREPLENACRLMEKTFMEKQLTREEITLLNCSDFRCLGLISMLLAVFNGSTLRAKEAYFYQTAGNEVNTQNLIREMKQAGRARKDENIRKRLESVAAGKFIYNLRDNPGTYSYLKRQSTERNMKIHELAAQFGFTYKAAAVTVINPAEIWDLRSKGLTYTKIAQRLNSNPTTISGLCLKHFGGDPLIPRPIDDYITVQELMNRYHMDHKTIMKLVSENHLENHMTVRHRYLKKSEIIPILLDYTQKSLQHQALMNRYIIR